LPVKRRRWGFEGFLDHPQVLPAVGAEFGVSRDRLVAGGAGTGVHYCFEDLFTRIN
jgi:hypothetical protein